MLDVWSTSRWKWVIITSASVMIGTHHHDKPVRKVFRSKLELDLGDDRPSFGHALSNRANGNYDDDDDDYGDAGNRRWFRSESACEVSRPVDQRRRHMKSFSRTVTDGRELFLTPQIKWTKKIVHSFSQRKKCSRSPERINHFFVR